MNTRLFIPGPTDVAEPVRLAMARPMIGHRSDAFEDLNERVTTRSRDPFGTEGTVLVGTCSSTGWMEAVRNLIRRGALFMVNGAFAARWYEIARENGKNAVRCNVPWGQPVRAEAVEAALDREACDAVALVHTETSTGVLSPLAEVAAELRGQPDVLLLVDAVSSLGAAPIEMDALGIDLCLAGSQKALGLPPGLALCAVSERAFARAADVPHRGHYFDLLVYRAFHEKRSRPTTPAIPLFWALDAQLDRIASSDAFLRTGKAGPTLTRNTPEGGSPCASRGRGK
jgi:aspartate aminotransferase-like enzyme